MKIAVIGTGYVGLVTGTCLAELGNNVICVDIDEKKIENLKKGIIPIYEPGLKELVLRNQSENRLSFTTDANSAIQESVVVFSAVGTPPDKDHKADLSAVKAVAKIFGENLNGYKVFVNKSTVPVGTSHMVADIITASGSSSAEQLHGRDFDVVDNPEFLREGAAVKDFLNPDRIVCGTESDKAREIMEKIYQPLTRAGRSLVFTDIPSAEIIKYASNSFLATKISFINEVANFCELAGADVTQVAKGIGLDDRIGPRFLHAGIGYGGSCFPKDVDAFIKTGEEFGMEFEILKAVQGVNQKQKSKLVEKLVKRVGDISGKTIAIWGLAFKPMTDDMREAPSLTIINELIKRGAKVQAFDPEAMERAKEILPAGVEYFNNAYDAVKNVDALLIVTEWNEFRSVDLGKVKELMKGNLIFDGRNIYQSEEMLRMGFEYESIGRLSVKSRERNGLGRPKTKQNAEINAVDLS